MKINDIKVPAKKIRTESDFLDKLNDIGEIFGVRFKLTGEDVYMIDDNGNSIKMKNKGSHYSRKINGKEICMSYMFSQHFFSTSVLIEVYSNDGKKRDCCRIEQELRPQSGIRTYPAFTYSSFQNGTTHLFYSNSFLIETAITSGMDIHIFDAIKKYENNGKIKNIDRMTAKFTKPNITRFLCGIDDSNGILAPHTEFEIYRGYKGHKYIISVLPGDCRLYEDISSEYKYDPEGFYAILPFFKRDYIDEEQFLENCNNLTQENWNNLLLSIIQNNAAITCFEDTIDYCRNSIASSYILNNYSELIDNIKSLQGNIVTKEKPFGRILANSIYSIQNK